jgi:hypothetical protein
MEVILLEKVGKLGAMSLSLKRAVLSLKSLHKSNWMPQIRAPKR